MKHLWAQAALGVPAILRKWGGLAVLLAIGTVAQADIVIPAGASYQKAGSALNLGCTDLQVSGTLVQGAGGSIVNVRNVQINVGGLLDISGASVQLAQNYSNQGSVVATGGSVTRVDSVACPAAGPLGAVDPSGKATAAVAAVPVPSLQPLALLLLSLLLAALGAWRVRRQR